MEYLDEQILESRKELERQQHTTLATGIYVDNELVTFSCVTLPDTLIQVFLPNQFIIMPEKIKAMKYPSKEAPDWVFTSLDHTINMCFNILPIKLAKNDIQVLSEQFKTALTNINPAIKIKELTEVANEVGNEMSCFEFIGSTLDGQNYNRMNLMKLKSTVLHGIFNCPLNVKHQWNGIANQCFGSVREVPQVL